MKWAIESIDISSAFLQGDPLQRDVYIIPPSDICTEGVAWKLKCCIYRLNDAPRAWYEKVKSEMKFSGATLSKFDNALFMWHRKDKLIGILVTHVDDFVFGGIDEWKKSVIGMIRKKFKISSSHSSSFNFLGLAVEQDEDEIAISQKIYIYFRDQTNYCYCQ